jgi:hypothetical protein
VHGRILAHLEWPEMVLDFHSECPAGSACIVALSITGRYSPRVRAVSASPELELAGMNGLAGDTYDFELRLGHFYAVFLCAGNI